MSGSGNVGAIWGLLGQHVSSVPQVPLGPFAKPATVPPMATVMMAWGLWLLLLR